MSDRSPDTRHRHPTDERTADQNTQSASGVARSRPQSGHEEDVLNRNEEGRYETPRQYEADDDTDEPRLRKP
jgi:hypothetical protein